MKVNFKRAVRLGKKNYAKGMHEVPCAFASNWFFLALQKDGLAIVQHEKAEPKKAEAVLADNVKKDSAEMVEAKKEGAPSIDVGEDVEYKEESGSKKRKKRE